MATVEISMASPTPDAVTKFTDPRITLSGATRAVVTLVQLKTLWFNTGTLCNIACTNCYIDSSPRNDRLSYLTRREVAGFLAEARSEHPNLCEIGFTGGEPFMNPDIIAMMGDAVEAGYRVLVLTNAMKPLAHRRVELAALQERHPGRMAVRVSLDHHTRAGHEAVRGPDTWAPAIDGLRWLAGAGFHPSVACRLPAAETESDMREGFQALFTSLGLDIPSGDPGRLVLFPEMDTARDVPEITDQCWSILHKDPADLMCASSRMVVRRRGEQGPRVVACTLLPYDPRFDLGATLAEAGGEVALNHPFCAQFCVLGGASCSAT